MSLFQSNLRKQIRNLPKILNFVKIIHYFSKLFTSLLTEDPDICYMQLAAWQVVQVFIQRWQGPRGEGRRPKGKGAIGAIALIARGRANLTGFVLGCIEANFCK